MHHAEPDRAERARQWAGRPRDAPHPRGTLKNIATTVTAPSTLPSETWGAKPEAWNVKPEA